MAVCQLQPSPMPLPPNRRLVPPKSPGYGGGSWKVVEEPHAGAAAVANTLVLHAAVVMRRVAVALVDRSSDLEACCLRVAAPPYIPKALQVRTALNPEP